MSFDQFGLHFPLVLFNKAYNDVLYSMELTLLNSILLTTPGIKIPRRNDPELNAKSKTICAVRKNGNGNKVNDRKQPTDPYIQKYLMYSLK
jgi:hypothetical protein